jgi:hypothetical protein
MSIGALFRRPRLGPALGPKKIDLGDQPRGFFGQHRSGWPYVLKLLSRLQNPSGVYLDSFIERTFCWHPDGPRAHRRPWVGFIHVPPGVPPWFQAEQSNEAIFRTALWKESAPLCRGLFTLSRYHRRALEARLEIAVENLIFPTETPRLKWTWDRFAANRDKKIIQVGWWLRKLHTIFMLPTRSYRKIFLRVTHADLDALLRRERELLARSGEFRDSMYDTAEQVVYVPNDAYDRLLSENVVILNLYDSSANNTLIECMVRHTPLLVNPVEAVVEYLGPDYPLYFETLDEAAAKAESPDLLRAASRYLAGHPGLAALDGDHFLESFVKSGIYGSL